MKKHPYDDIQDLFNKAFVVFVVVFIVLAHILFSIPWYTLLIMLGVPLAAFIAASVVVVMYAMVLSTIISIKGLRGNGKDNSTR